MTYLLKMRSIKTANIKRATFSFLFFILLKTFPSFSQVNGCTDPSANNYNPSATVNDGSCTYNVTNYIPTKIVDPISDTLKESSGLQWAGNSLWSFNDKNGTPDLYRIDTASKKILQTVRLSGATNVDWEEVTFDGTYFYVGDFGNNVNGARTDLKIYKFPFSSIPDYATTSQAAIDPAKIDIIKFRYSDQKDILAVELNSTKFDCEAMIVSGGKIHLFTKDWISYTSTHYVINSTLAGSYVATPVETLNTGYLVTGASKAPGQEVIALLGYIDAGFGNHYMHLLSAYSDGKYFNGNKRKIDLSTASEMGQAEGITFRNDSYGYISNEKLQTPFSTVYQKLHSFNTSSFIPSNILAVQLSNFNVNTINAEDKIVWSFNLPVHGLQIEQSFDGIHFNVLKTYDISTTGSFYNKPASGNNFYRIAWKENNGQIKYSRIISIKNHDNNLISHLSLKANGELSFRLNGSQEESYTFRLLTTDGKEVSQITGSYKPGINKINFSSGADLNGVVLLTGYGDKQKITRLLYVMK